METPFWKQEEGQGLLEYGLLIVLIAVLLIVLVAILGEQIQQVYCQIAIAMRDGANMSFPPFPDWCVALTP